MTLLSTLTSSLLYHPFHLPHNWPNHFFWNKLLFTSNKKYLLSSHRHRSVIHFHLFCPHLPIDYSTAISLTGGAGRIQRDSHCEPTRANKTTTENHRFATSVSIESLWDQVELPNPLQSLSATSKTTNQTRWALVSTEWLTLEFFA